MTLSFVGSRIHKLEMNFIKLKEDQSSKQNKTFFALLVLFKSKDIHRGSKIKFYKPVIRSKLCAFCV
jgi:hypothetical protein